MPPREQVTVEVPATSANLGPGFDCLGVALTLRDTITGEVTDEGFDIVVEGEGAGSLPTDDGHLVCSSVRDVFELLDEPLPGLRLRCVNRVPQSRGLGSSSAAIVGGLVLGRALAGAEDRLSDHDLLVLANAREGHPDNVAPALIGGFVVSGRGDDEVWAVRAPLASGLAVTVFVPPTPVSTKTARSLLPTAVPHTTAAANTGRAALLVAALGGATDQLLRATADFLHQDYREAAMPESLALVHRLRDQGVPASVSGAGPTVLAWRQGTLDAAAPEGWLRLDLEVDHVGARVVGG